MAITLKNKCPYCFYKLAQDGFCARVCKMGALKRKQYELSQGTQEVKDNTTEENISSKDTE